MSGDHLALEFGRLPSRWREGPRHGAGATLGILVVDMQEYFLPPDDEAGKVVLKNIATVLAAARAEPVPIFLAVVVIDAISEVNPAWRARHDMKGLLRGQPGTRLHRSIGPEPGDVVVEKRHASCFLGTSLLDQLKRLEVDTLLLCGATTSGCVRATAVDGAGLGLRMELIEDCVYEPRPLSGAVALADLQERYADVITRSEALGQIATIGYRGPNAR